MTPIEAMAKAIAKEDWGVGRAGGPWSDELWERLLKGYRTAEAQAGADWMSRVAMEMHYLDKIFRQARGALLALGELELPELLSAIAKEKIDEGEDLCRAQG